MKGLHEVTPLSQILPGSCGGHEPGLEVWGVIDVAEDPITGTECEQVDPDDDRTPDFWSVYDHDDDGHCMVVDDFQSRELALHAAQRLGSSHGLPVYDFTKEGYR